MNPKNLTLKPVKQIFHIKLLDDINGTISEIKVYDRNGAFITNITGDKYRQEDAKFYRTYNYDKIADDAVKDGFNDWSEGEIRDYYTNKEMHMLDLANEIQNGRGEENNYVLTELNEFLQSQVIQGGHVLVYVGDREYYDDTFENVHLECGGGKMWPIKYTSKIENGNLVFDFLDEEEKQRRDVEAQKIANDEYDDEADLNKLNDAKNMLDFYARYTTKQFAHVFWQGGLWRDENFEEKNYFLLFQNSDFTALFQPIEEIEKDAQKQYDFKSIVYDKKYLNQEDKRSATIVDYVKTVEKDYQQEYQLNKGKSR